MHRVTPKHILEFEKQMAQRLVERFQLDLRALVYDGANFFTYINTRTPADLPQRGHNKQKRGDLRQVSLGLLVAADFRIPLFHKVYAGNIHDSVEFRSITEDLAFHYRQLAQSCEHITLAFDKGNNSEEAFGALEDTPFHFVGSLVPSQHPDLLAVPRGQFRTLTAPRLEGVPVYRTQKKVFGQARTIVVTFNHNLFDGQLQGLTANLRKARHKLRALETQLRRRREGQLKGGQAPTLDSVRKQIRSLCSAQWVGKVLQAEVREVGRGLELQFHTDQTALDRLCRLQLGKTVLFTDNADWSEEQIVLALLLSSLLQRQLASQQEELSINRILEELAGIRETLIVYPRRQGQRRFPTVTCLSRMNPLQRRLFSVLDLARYQPPAR
jgi:transposase